MSVKKIIGLVQEFLYDLIEGQIKSCKDEITLPKI